MKNDKLSRVFISKKISYACFKIAFTINHYTERKLFKRIKYGDCKK